MSPLDAIVGTVCAVAGGVSSVVLGACAVAYYVSEWRRTP